MQRWKSDREDEFFYLKLLLAAAVVILVVAGLIEWNARRQAAAMTRELLRPATPQEQAQIDRYQREAAAEMQRMEREIRRPSRPAAQPRVNTRPLRDDERCIDGQRFRRIENGWLQAGTCRS